MERGDHTVRKALLVIVVLGLLCSSPQRVKVVRLEGSRLVAESWIGDSARLAAAGDALDLGFDKATRKKSAEEILRLVVEIEREWDLPDEWEVVQARLGDLNQDGQQEASLLVWRAFQPWPIDRFLPHGGRLHGFHDASGRSCHLILLGRRDDRFGELWAGSALVDPILDFAVVDLDGDGKDEFLAMEGKYTDMSRSKAWALSVWEWNGFGFTLVDRLHGNFRHASILALPNGGKSVLYSQ